MISCGPMVLGPVLRRAGIALWHVKVALLSAAAYFYRRHGQRRQEDGEGMHGREFLLSKAQRLRPSRIKMTILAAPDTFARSAPASLRGH